MNNLIEKKELKSILHSKRSNIFYLEKCRIMEKDGRVLYLSCNKKQNNYYNIPIANTTVILLGIGTSITNSAVRNLCAAGVIIGFTGNGGSPLVAGREVEWLTPASEYRPPQYVQKWLRFWYDETKRLNIAKKIQLKRCEFLENTWKDDKFFNGNGFSSEDIEIITALEGFRRKIASGSSVKDLLSAEGQFTKDLYKYAATNTKLGNFTRDHKSNDIANRFLTHGNYLAYGAASVPLWVLGIPYAFPAMHGRTTRGGLVFDVADLIKDSIVLPTAFICAKKAETDTRFRETILEHFVTYKVLDKMFDTLEEMCMVYDTGGDTHDCTVL